MGANKITKVIRKLNLLYCFKPKRDRPFDILVHGILSARTKDETTFPAQYRLLRAASTPDKMSRLSVKRIERLIYPVGFYKTKARHIKNTCKLLLTEFGGKVPRTKEELMKLSGVGPKVASLVLVWGFGMPVIPVDTHVNRISQRLGIVPIGTRPEKTQEVLEKSLSPALTTIANKVLVKFGKTICRPIGPHCYECPVYTYCAFDKKAYYRQRFTSKQDNTY